MKTEGS